jgi:hypothetical protein
MEGALRKKHYARRGRMAVALVLVLAAPGPIASAANAVDPQTSRSRNASKATDAPNWAPLRGDSIRVECTWANPDNGCVINGKPYHAKLAIDFAVGNNTPVYAAGGGSVHSYGGCEPYIRDDDCNGGAGNYITIWHAGAGRYSRYLHLSSFVVTSGRVESGGLIAYTGNSGYSLGSHLHYDETNGDGTKLDPDSMLACQGSDQVIYPDAAGSSTWPGLDLPAYLGSDGTDCGSPPPSGTGFKDDVFQAVGGDIGWRVRYGGTSAWKTLSSSGAVDGLALGDFNHDGVDDVFQAAGGDVGWRVRYGGTSAWVDLAKSGAVMPLLIGDFE